VAEKTISLIPTPDGKQVPAEDLAFKTKSEEWNVYEAADGTIIRLKVIALKISRGLDGDKPLYKEDGEPLYNVRFQTIISCDSRHHPSDMAWPVYVHQEHTPQEHNAVQLEPEERIAMIVRSAWSYRDIRWLAGVSPVMFLVGIGSLPITIRTEGIWPLSVGLILVGICSAVFARLLAVERGKES